MNNLGTCQRIYISQLFCSMLVLLSRILISKWWSSKVADKALLFCLLHGCTCFIHGWKRVKYYKFLKKPFYLFSYLLILSHMKKTAVNFMITLSTVPNDRMFVNMPELSEMDFSRLSYIEEYLPHFGLSKKLTVQSFKWLFHLIQNWNADSLMGAVKSSRTWSISSSFSRSF